MRRKGHPSRPRAMTCCFFASLKTLLIPTKATALRRNQRPRASFPLAGFEVTLIGRFWVAPEDMLKPGTDEDSSLDDKLKTWSGSLVMNACFHARSCPKANCANSC